MELTLFLDLRSRLQIIHHLKCNPVMITHNSIVVPEGDGTIYRVLLTSFHGNDERIFRQFCWCNWILDVNDERIFRLLC